MLAKTIPVTPAGATALPVFMLIKFPHEKESLQAIVTSARQGAQLQMFAKILYLSDSNKGLALEALSYLVRDPQVPFECKVDLLAARFLIVQSGSSQLTPGNTQALTTLTPKLLKKLNASETLDIYGLSSYFGTTEKTIREHREFFEKLPSFKKTSNGNFSVSALELNKVTFEEGI